MALDLRGLRPNLDELLLRDRCDIYRDTKGATDDATSGITGIVATAGSVLIGSFDCKLKPTYRNLSEIAGGQPRVIGFYDLSIPAGSGPMKVGDQVQVMLCDHDPSLVGKTLRIEEILHSTFNLFHKARCELRERYSDRP